MSVFLTPPTVADARVINVVLCLSLFDEPSHQGKLAELRRLSKATSLHGLVDYIRTSDLSMAEVLELSADVKRRMTAINADIERVWSTPLKVRSRKAPA